MFIDLAAGEGIAVIGGILVMIAAFSGAGWALMKGLRSDDPR